MSTWIARENPTRSLACRRVRGELQPYLDGVLAETRAEPVAQHLRSCRGCRREAAVYQAIKDSLNRQRSSPGAVARLRKFGAALLGEAGGSAPTPRTARG